MTQKTVSLPNAIDPTAAAAWRRTLPVLVILLLAIVAIYRDTAMSMVELWMHNETYTHGFAVPLIVIWLVWRIRSQLTLLSPRSNPWVLLPLATAGFIWLLGEIAAVVVVSQFAFVAMLVLAVPAVLGLQVARRMIFPLAFLFFAVPFGEFATPQMMEWTANVTVMALRATGIPVYMEGLQFIIPSGHWSVVEACSGVRYIIASLTVGTLFAYLTYRSFKRRLLFVAVSLVVPLAANWLRAYMIVMLGHLSGNRLAAGVDHLVYGWVLFGIVIMIMFWIGSRWSEDELPITKPYTDSALPSSRTVLSTMLAAVLVFLVTLVWPLTEWQINRNPSAQVKVIESPGSIAGWTESDQAFADWEPSFDRPSAVLQTAFGVENRKVGVYVAYYRNQDYSRKLVSSTNVLVKSNDPDWSRVESGTRRIDFGHESFSARTAELKSTGGKSLLVWQWYWINGYFTANDPLAKALTAFSKLLGQGDDSAVIFLYVPKEEGEAVLEAFAGDAGEAIRNALTQTRNNR